MPPRLDVLSRGYAYAFGLLEGAAVSCRNKDKSEVGHDEGTVLGWIDDQVLVQWSESNNCSTNERFHIGIDLNCMVGATDKIYPDHLPILGEDTQGHLDVDFDHNGKLKKELVKKGFRILERGDTDITECEIKYFIRMAEYVLDEKVLPVIISVRNGGLSQDVLNSAGSLLLPIIRFKKNSPDVSVFTLKEVSSKLNEVTEHITNLRTPWTIKSEDPIEIENATRKDEISALNDVRSNLDFAALICHLVIGDDLRFLQCRLIMGQQSL
ncbi:Hypothetical predicted protein [Mytilus galloprovincialis]|uniref:Uncharacterized protein n=1 Tax=Mytilus galloprovincialis TaxID=29158 RepID=A0A8B6BWM4_MYTGA|nr:Hypothetical predicted protein [Mytilus galloprovincialis]